MSIRLIIGFALIACAAAAFAFFRNIDGSQNVAGAFITLALVTLLTKFLVRVAEKCARKTHGGKDPHPDKGDSPIGYVESLIFYGALSMGTLAGAFALIAPWLVFKTAAKWKTWELSMKELPSGDPYKSPGEIAARYEAFLVGTGANILFAMIGTALAQRFS